MELYHLSKTCTILSMSIFYSPLSTTNIQKEVLWVILSRLEKKGWIERIEKESI